jgi:hypothetical protein
MITGVHPLLKVNRIYALYIPADEIAVVIKRGEAEGWTELQASNQPQPSLWGDESDSSESEKPQSKKEPSSSPSGAASRASVTRSSRSPRKVRQRK